MTRFAFNQPISNFMSENRMDEVAAIGAKLEDKEDIFNTKLKQGLTSNIIQGETAVDAQGLISDAQGSARNNAMLGGLLETGTGLFAGGARMKANGIGMFGGSGDQFSYDPSLTSSYSSPSSYDFSDLYRT